MRRALVTASALVSASFAAGAESVDELLASRALDNVVHPIAAEFVAAEGGRLLSDAQRATASTQLKRALQRQTSPMVLTMRGTTAMMSTPSMQRMQEQARKATSAGGIAGGIIKSQLGIGGPGATEIDAEQAEREAQQAMAEPWVRGIGAARALAALGDANAAAGFYVSCLQMLEADWVPDACLEDIIALGPQRAELLLAWMLENADKTSYGGLGVDLGGDSRGSGPDRGTVQLRNAALEGLGALVGSGLLPAESRERAFVQVLAYAAGRDNEPYLIGVAEGLARSGDARAVEPLRKLAERRNLPDVRQAALRGLAVGFHDQAAVAKLRGELDDRDTDVQLRAAQALYETGEPKAFEWATDVITRRRTTDTDKPDIRAQVVRDLVELGGANSRQALQLALDDGLKNDWLEAWVAVGLLELGDVSAAARVEAALANDDWQLDPRGVRSIWRVIKPFLQYAAQMAMSGGLGATMSSSQQLRQVTSLVGNAVVGERGRHLQKLSQRESLTAQLRWQAADAIATARPDRAVEMLSGLLGDDTPGVRASATLALARVEEPEALALLVSSYDDALTAASALAPEARATLVRAAFVQAPAAPATKELLAKASADPDPGVRFIAVAASAAP
jgi:HEAT repeat protein